MRLARNPILPCNASVSLFSGPQTVLVRCLLGKACTVLVGRDKGSINDAGSRGTELLVPLQLCPYSAAVSLQLIINL